MLLAFLFSALAPAFGSGQGGGAALRAVWGEICTATDGLHNGAYDSAPGDAHDMSHAGHCLLCFFPSTTPDNKPLAPLAGVAPIIRVAAQQSAPGWYSQGWHAPQARAPPVFPDLLA
ncbi:DUF2946 domain-containing protein [Pusillimonas sp. TS35]|nr:DUF2946 domain-containing protein [Pusillimonas sp. TS35]